MKKRYARKLLVNPRYQMVQIGVVVLANSLVTLLVAGLLSWFYLLYWDGSIVVQHNARIPYYVLAAVLLVTSLTVLFSLQRSRMVAGMMKKIQMVLENAEAGRFPEQPLAFRKSDSFPQLAAPLNRCLDRMRYPADILLRVQLQGLLAELDEEKIGVDVVCARLREIARPTDVA